MTIRLPGTGSTLCRFIGSEEASEALNSSTGTLFCRKYEREAMRGQRRATGCRRTPARVARKRQRVRSGACQPRVQALKDGYYRTAVTEGELDAPTSVNHPRGQVHQLLHNGTDTPALGAMARRSIRAEQAVLPDPAQDVVGQHGTGEDQGVGGELARGKPLDVQRS